MREGVIPNRQFFSSFQCILSFVGSVGVILIFAGLPQLIYSDDINVSNTLTFAVGVIFVLVMIAGNILINHLIRTRISSTREDEENPQQIMEDKPPNYDDLVRSEGTPPDYKAAFPEKPPSYEDVVSVHQASGSSVPSLPQEPTTSRETQVT